MKDTVEGLIFGRNPVKEALYSNRVKLVYLNPNFSFEPIVSLLKEKHIPMTYKSNKELDMMCDGVHQGIAAVIKDYEYYSFESILDRKSVV